MSGFEDPSPLSSERPVAKCMSLPRCLTSVSRSSLAPRARAKHPDLQIGPNVLDRSDRRHRRHWPGRDRSAGGPRPTIKANRGPYLLMLFGRGERIRTSDPSVPNRRKGKDSPNRGVVNRRPVGKHGRSCPLPASHRRRGRAARQVIAATTMTNHRPTDAEAGRQRRPLLAVPTFDSRAPSRRAKTRRKA